MRFFLTIRWSFVAVDSKNVIPLSEKFSLAMKEDCSMNYQINYQMHPLEWREDYVVLLAHSDTSLIVIRGIEYLPPAFEKYRGQVVFGIGLHDGRIELCQFRS